MKKYTDGYYIYEHVDFTCYQTLKSCDGCNRLLVGFAYEVKIQTTQEKLCFCGQCMRTLTEISVNK
ncbi:hypothetical protein RFI36_02140 [Acinetobacter gerneri]|jgi:hypothetical protein|uniref:Cysteine-rich protein n=1 Tax=Acinetobacter gerneri TaxID=202952 RepID=A0AAW8JBN8_9GAMM|nr:hypothetical protein [Acinetobacter gerneri]MCH4245803.1 hypothetical protein [Acinetobacter gerneri]MDQ9008385.1 hypothetical protein [Acinetobacter gerneri]MDQ9012650.1 hypothetical protein [Acinetobacter gerneri]MDQ9024085.1 hypothetical protein [Acinetobacter gerneri]MDQ9050953.1 hypothetical protein [Acinetobacter gerneri]